MAEKKLTLATLRKMLAKQTGMPESKVETFLDNFFQTIVSGLKEDGQVRLNGLGTFKVQAIQPRKSVNIKTGESIIIDGYNKVVFTAEPALKEQANADNPNFKSVKLQGKAAPVVAADGIDPLQKLGEQAEEIKDILAELGVSTTETVTETPEEPVAQDAPIVPIVPEIPDEPEKTEVTETPEKPQPVEPEPEPVTEPETEPISEPVPEPVPEKKEEKKEDEENKEKPFQPWKVAGITIVIFCLLLVGAYFFLRHKLTTWADSLLDKDNQTEQVQTPSETTPEATDVTPIAADSTTESAEQAPEQTPDQVEEPKQEDPMQNWYGGERKYEKFIKTETLGEGSRLTHLSRKYYGAPDFWVYIYEANKDRIKNPNKIGRGTKLRIPELPAELIDTNNEKSMKQAKELHNKILGKK